MYQLEPVVCELCGSNKSKIVTKAKISPFGALSNLVKCQTCGLVYFSPRPTSSFEIDFYHSKYIENYDVNTWYQQRIRTFKHILSKLARYVPNRERLLDIGCGMGFFLKEAEINGWKDIIGEDISDFAVRYARQELGLNVLKGSLKELDLPEGYFNVITILNVIDQIREPMDMLVRSNTLLKEGGLIVLRVSNLLFHLAMLRVAKFFRMKINFLNQSCFHLYAFSASTIKKALKKAGFNEIKVFNAPIEGGDNPASSAISSFIRALTFAFAQFVYYLTFTKVIIGPSILVFARKA